MAEYQEMEGLSRSLVREAPPTHFLLRIESFSLLSSSSLDIERFESCEFEACDHKWKLALYPNGDEERGGGDHISLYLVLMNTSSFGLNKELVVSYNLSLLDQKRDKYFGAQGVTRFHPFKSESGFCKLLPLSTFNDPSNGYLVDDTCVFGAEISLVKRTMKGQVLRKILDPVPFKYTWKLEKFSELKDEYYVSKVFTVKNHDFKVYLYLYPKGYDTGKGKYLSVYIALAEPKKLSPGGVVILDYRFCVMNKVCKHKVSRTDTVCLHASDKDDGFAEFMPLEDLSSSSGYLVNDTLTIETEVTIIGLTEEWQ